MKYASVFCINIQLLAIVTSTHIHFSATVSKNQGDYAFINEYMHCENIIISCKFSFSLKITSPTYAYLCIFMHIYAYLYDNHFEIHKQKRYTKVHRLYFILLIESAQKCFQSFGFRIIKHLRCSLLSDYTLVHKDDFVGNFFCEIHFVCNDNHRTITIF